MTSNATAPHGATLKGTVDALLHGAVAAGDVPGVAAMVTDRDGLRYEGAFGKRVLGQAAPMTTDTVALMASMTKALTCTAALQLVEQGRLELDMPAERWVPALGEAQVLEGFDAAGEPRLRPPVRPITLRHLLTHTAGFGYDLWNAEIGRYQQARGLPRVNSGQLAALRTPLLTDPGERWNYGINIDHVGLAVEAASGMKLGAYLQAHVFAPLGMVDTAFRITPAMRERLAKVHQRDADGSLHPLLEMETNQQPEFEGGGGGLYGTARDYLRFVRMILNEGRLDGRQVLRPETVREMGRNQIGALRVRPMAAAVPAFTNAAEFFPGLPKAWSLGFMLNLETAPTGRSAGSMAWAGLTNVYCWIDPVQGLGGVYFTQIFPFVDVKSLPLFLAFEAAVYRAL